MENAVDDTTEQKWWYSFVIAFIFFIVLSPIVQIPINNFFVRLGGCHLIEDYGLNLVGLVMYAIIFMLCVRLYLW